MSQCITLKTLGGTDLNPGTGEYTSETHNDHRLTTNERDIQTAKRSGRGVAYTGTVYKGRMIRVKHRITGTGTTHEENLSKLRREHYRNRHEEKTLIYTDSDGTDKQVTVKVAGMAGIGEGFDEGVVYGTWLLLDIVEVSSTASDVTAASKSSSPATLSVTNDGDEDSEHIVLTIKPTAQKAATDGQRYAYYITPVNRNEWGFARAPVDITDNFGGAAGWDHAAEVTATRSASDGDDVEVYVNGRRQMRWADTWNDAASQIWTALTMPPGRHWTYNGNAALGAAVTSMTVRETLTAMPPLPFYAAFVEGAATREVVRVTAYEEETRTLTIVRGTRGTSGQTHAVDSKLYYCPVLIDLVYGWTSAPTPDYQDDDYKPMLSMGSSTNASWVYTDYQETDASGETQSRKPRPGTWATRDTIDRSREKKTGQGDLYLQYVPWTNGLGSDAATAASMSLGYLAAGAKAGHPLMSEWYLKLPWGCTQIVATETTSTLDFSIHESQLLYVAVGEDGEEDILAEYDGDGATARTLTPAANAYEVVFRIDPWDPKTDSATASEVPGEPTDNDGFVIDTITLTLDSGEEPLMIWGTSRRNIYQLGRPDDPLTLANADGDTLDIAGLVVGLTDTVDIDVEAGEITIDDGTAHTHLTSGEFPALLPDTNNYTLTETGLGTLDFGVSSYRSAWIV